MELAQESFNNYLNLFSFLLVPTIGLFTYLFFRKASINLAEHLTAQAFLMSLTTAISLLFMGLALNHVAAYTIAVFLMGRTYQIWWCLSFANKKGAIRNSLAAFASFLFGYVLYDLLISLMVCIDVGMKVGAMR